MNHHNAPIPSEQPISTGGQQHHFGHAHQNGALPTSAAPAAVGASSTFSPHQQQVGGVAHQQFAHHDRHSETTLPQQPQITPRKGGFFASAPTFKGWLKQYGPDILTMAALGAVALGVYEADPAPSRSFAIDFQDGEIVYPQFAYPLRNEIIPIWAAAMIAFFVPLVSFGIVQIRVKSFENFNAAVFGLLYSLITAATFQVFIKWLIGGLRPHFLAVCKPVIPAGMVGNGFQSIYFDRSICTGDKKQINDSLESMPSGHSTAAWAGLLFLSLYLNGHLKIFSDHRVYFWKMIVMFAPILGAVLIASALTIDEYHNWYDIVAGSTIGAVCAFAAYRISFASIWDFRFNHVALPRDTSVVGRYPYTLGNGGVGDEAHYAQSYFPRPWRNGQSSMGAPGDAAVRHHGAGLATGGVANGLAHGHGHAGQHGHHLGGGHHNKEVSHV